MLKLYAHAMVKNIENKIENDIAMKIRRLSKGTSN